MFVFQEAMEKMTKVGKVIQPNHELQRWDEDNLMQMLNQSNLIFFLINLNSLHFIPIIQYILNMCAYNLTWVINDYELRSPNGTKWIIVCPKWPDERRTKILFLHNYMIQFKYWVQSLWIWATRAQKTNNPLKLYAKQHIFELLFALCLFQLLWEEVRGFPETVCPPEGVPGPHEPEMTPLAAKGCAGTDSL